MLPVEIFEHKRYTFKELSKMFDMDEKSTKPILKNLKDYGVLKTSHLTSDQQNFSNLLEENTDDNIIGKEKYYVFTFVGILIVHNLVLKCFPKYLKKMHMDDELKNKKLKQIIKIIKKYNSKKQIINIQNLINENSNFNLLSMMIYFIEDYYKNGLYSNYQNIIEYNGSGEILWDKTINENQPLIHNNVPYYTDFYTKKSKLDDYDYFKLLHETILTICSKKLEDAGLLDLFDLTPVNLNNSNLNNFGEIDFIVYKINQELNTQFNSRKQDLLKAMHSFILNKNSFIGGDNEFSMYGTNSYNLIWEDMCCSVLGDIKDKKFSNLKFPKELNSNYKGSDNFLSIIEKPKWNFFNEKYNTSQIHRRTLKPDLINFYKENNKWIFVIMDAKYYNLDDSFPGIESVSKQHLYELAYKEFLAAHNFDEVKNCFLFPSVENKITKEGNVKLEFLSNALDDDLKDIQIILLPVEKINEFYLNNKKLNLTELNL